MTKERTMQMRGRQWSIILAATGLAASGAVVWGGISAVETVANVVAVATPGKTADASGGGSGNQGAGTAGGADTAAQAPASQAPGSGRTRLQTPGPTPAVPQSLVASPGLGNKSEVSLAEAGNAEVGPAAGSRQGGNDHSTGLKERGAVNPADVLAAKNLSLGGCLIQYGADGQCLPAVPPSLSQHLQEMKDAGMDPASMPHSWACGEVREYFKDGLIVRKPNVDPQNLDTNKDGTACGPGD